MFGVEEFGIDVFGRDEISADDEDLRGNVSTQTIRPKTEGFCKEAHLEDGGFVASTVLNSCPKTHIKLL